MVGINEISALESHFSSALNEISFSFLFVSKGAEDIFLILPYDPIYHGEDGSFLASQRGSLGSFVNAHEAYCE